MYKQLIKIETCVNITKGNKTHLSRDLRLNSDINLSSYAWISNQNYALVFGNCFSHV